MATRKKLEPTFEPGRSYVVKGELLNQIATQLRDQTPLAGPGILLKEVAGGVMIQADAAAFISTQGAFKIHSGTGGSGLVMGVGPFGTLYDAVVDGDPAAVTVAGRLSDPSNMSDGGWFSAAVGDFLVLKATIVDGAITEAEIEKASSEPTLVEFSDYVQTLFRVPLAMVVSIGGKATVVPLREGEMLADATIINSKWAKYVR